MGIIGVSRGSMRIGRGRCRAVDRSWGRAVDRAVGRAVSGAVDRAVGRAVCRCINMGRSRSSILISATSVTPKIKKTFNIFSKLLKD